MLEEQERKRHEAVVAADNIPPPLDEYLKSVDDNLVEFFRDYKSTQAENYKPKVAIAGLMDRYANLRQDAIYGSIAAVLHKLMYPYRYAMKDLANDISRADENSSLGMTKIGKYMRDLKMQWSNMNLSKVNAAYIVEQMLWLFFAGVQTTPTITNAAENLWRFFQKAADYKDDAKRIYAVLAFINTIEAAYADN